MKKTAIALAVALAGFTTVAQAAPKDDTWYVGGKLGWSKYYKTELPDFTSKTNGVGGGAFFGYQANPYLGFEMGLDWLGRLKYDNTVDQINSKYSAYGVQLAAKLSYPLTNELDIYTRLGGMVWRAEHKVHDTDTVKQTDTGVSPLAAVGVEYAINKNWATRLDYQFVHKVGNEDKLGISPPNTGLLSVGLSYRFGQESTAIAPTPMPAPAPTPVVETKHYTLTSDVLFDYNKSSLKDKGQQALDNLYQQLSTLDPNDGSAVVVGYTDKIGSEHYNQKLSEERAKAVANYLVSKGFPASKISSSGMGKQNPVTGNSCDHIKARNALITCLAPDRRVEIEIQGVKEEAAPAKS